MNRKAILVGLSEWVVVLAVVAIAVSVFNARLIERESVRIEYNQRDAVQIAQQRTLHQLLQTPVVVDDRSLTLAELFTYRELDERYEPILVGQLAKYAPNTQITLRSGANILTQYGRPPEGTTYTLEAQIPSFTGKSLIVSLTAR